MIKQSNELFIVYFGNATEKNAPSQRVEAIKQCLNKRYNVRLIDNSSLIEKKIQINKIYAFFNRYIKITIKINAYIDKNKPECIILYNQDPVLLTFLGILSKMKGFTLVSQISERHLWGDYYYSLKAIHFFLEKLYFFILNCFRCKTIVISKYLKKKIPNSFFLPGILPFHKIRPFTLRENGKNIFYFGRGDARDDIETMILSFHKLGGILKCKKPKFYMVGLSEKAQRKAFSIINSMKIKNIIVDGFISNKKLESIIKKSSIFLFCRKNTCSVQACFPTRAAEMLVQNKLIITTPHSTIEIYAKKTDRIRIVPENNINRTALLLAAGISEKQPKRKLAYKMFRHEFSPSLFSYRLAKFLQAT